MKKIITGLLLLMTFNLYAQKTSQLPTATGTGKSGFLNIVQNGTSKKITADSIAAIAIKKADSVAAVLQIQITKNTDSLTAQGIRIATVIVPTVNIDLTGIAVNDYIKWDGTKFIKTPPVSGGTSTTTINQTINSVGGNSIVSNVFTDDFSTNKGYFPHPTYPITPDISAGTLKLAFTAATPQFIQLPISLPAGVTHFSIKVRRIAGTGTNLAIGATAGDATQDSTQAYRTILGSQITGVFQQFDFNITPGGFYLNKILWIGSPSGENTGATLEIDDLIIDYSQSLDVVVKNSIQGIVPAGLTTIVYNVNTRIFQLGAATYNITAPLDLPSGSTLRGIKGSTVLKLISGTEILNIQGKQNIVIEGITFEGTTAIGEPVTASRSDVINRTGLGTTAGIRTNSEGITVRDCLFRYFSQAGVVSTLGNFTKPNVFESNVFEYNYIGIWHTENSEFHKHTGNNFYKNKFGMYVQSGNITGSTNSFLFNSVGFVVNGINAPNDGHGTFVASQFTHSLSTGVYLINLTNGFVFAGCFFADGNIVLETVKGVVISGSWLAAGIDVLTDFPLGKNIFNSNIFTKTYGAGVITGSTTNLSMSGNRFIGAESPALINTTN